VLTLSSISAALLSLGSQFIAMPARYEFADPLTLISARRTLRCRRNGLSRCFAVMFQFKSLLPTQSGPSTVWIHWKQGNEQNFQIVKKHGFCKSLRGHELIAARPYFLTNRPNTWLLSCDQPGCRRSTEGLTCHACATISISVLKSILSELFSQISSKLPI
jgi:hypothetical protein